MPQCAANWTDSIDSSINHRMAGYMHGKNGLFFRWSIVRLFAHTRMRILRNVYNETPYHNKPFA